MQFILTLKKEKMENKKELLLTAVVAVILILGMTSLASAGFNLGNASISSQYIGGDTLIGWINISFSNQTNSNFTSNFDGSISLLDLMNKSGYRQGNGYTCSPSTCVNDYNFFNSATSKNIALSGKKIYGFAFLGVKNLEIQDFEFHLSSDANSSCANQLFLDLLNDGSYDFFNSEYEDTACAAKSYGCYDDSSTGIVSISVGTSKLCEKISMAPAPAYKIGASLNNSAINKNGLHMELYNINASDISPVATCDIPNNTQNVQDLDCIAKYASQNRFDALVCLYGDYLTNFTIKSETTDTCGKIDAGQGDYVRDYKIYQTQLKFATINKEFNSSLFAKLNNDASLIDLIRAYADSKYGNNCVGGCVIPFSLSGLNQNIIIDNVDIRYLADGIPPETPVSNNYVYDIVVSNFKVSSGFVKLILNNMNILVPNVNGNRLFSLSFNGVGILDKTINITLGLTFDISPKFVTIGKNTLFTANVSGNVTSTWDFGDGSDSVSSNDNKASHAYMNSGTYDVSVVIKKGTTTTTKTFKVTTGNVKEAANSTLTSYEKRIINLTNSIKSYPDWIRSDLIKEINTSEINASLVGIRTRFNNAVNDSQYEELLGDLLDLNVPITISKSDTGSNLPLLVGYSNIDTKFIEEISNASLTDDAKNSLRSSISTWMQANYDSRISYDVISKQFDSGPEPILTKFKISLSGKKDNPEQAYLIINYPREGIKFAENYDARNLDDGSATYIEVSGGKSFEFTIKSDVKADELGAYLSPVVSKLGTFEEIGQAEKPKFRWGLLLLGLGIVITATAIVFILMRRWYQNNYENRLFRTRNDVYNLVNFIYNSRLAGLKDEDIRKKLKESGWTGEQISYAFKKIDGKSKWLFEKRKVKKELEKRHPEGIDTRFINH